MNIKIKLGNAQLEFEGRDFKEAVKEASAFSQSTTCLLCKSKNVALDYRYAVAKQGDNVGKGYDYYKVKCLDCNAERQLGQYKEGGFFAKRWEMPEYGKNPHATKNTKIEPKVQFEDHNGEDAF